MKKIKKGIIYLLMAIMTFSFTAQATTANVHAQIGGDYCKIQKHLLSKKRITVTYSAKHCRSIVKFCDSYNKTIKRIDDLMDLYKKFSKKTKSPSLSSVQLKLLWYYAKGVGYNYKKTKALFNKAKKKNAGIKMSYILYVYDGPTGCTTEGKNYTYTFIKSK